MKVNIWNLVKGDEFFIGSYPDSFAIGRWFSAEELVSSSYGKIEKEYLIRFNPYNRPELELGVFDVDNYSRLWQGEYDVLDLIRRLKHIYATQEFELQGLKQDSYDNLKSVDESKSKEMLNQAVKELGLF